VGEAK